MEQDTAENSKWFTKEAEVDRVKEMLNQKTAKELKALGWEDTEDNRNRLFHRQKAEIIGNANQGDPKAQCLLGGLFFFGIDEEIDTVQGHAWLRIAQMNGVGFQSDFYGSPTPVESEAAAQLACQMIQDKPNLLKD